ncbi:MAG: hypothetical protein Q7V05_05545 [Methanoregula sp.]|nr:hypothetical protein [Methanoregula sp.]
MAFVEHAARKTGIFTMEKFTTFDIIIVSLIRTIGIIVGIIGNIFHDFSAL